MGNATGILIIQSAFLGDLLLAVPLLKNIRQMFPNEKISLVCRKGFGSFMQSLGLVDEFFEIEKKNKNSYEQVLKDLRGRNFLHLFAPHESIRTALMVRKIQAEKKIAYKKWWNFSTYSHRVIRNLQLPDSLRQLSLLTSLDQNIQNKIDEFMNREGHWKSEAGLLSPVPDFANPGIDLQKLDAVDFGKIKNFLANSQRRVVLFPGSVWKTKQWTEEGFHQVARELSKKFEEILLLGTKEEYELCQRVSAGIQNCRILAGSTNLLESLKLISISQLVIANDSAGQHLAALVGVPTVSIFGPTVLGFGYRPWNSNSIVVENSSLKCRPCGKHGHHVCPLGTHECMKSISAEAVLMAAKNL